MLNVLAKYFDLGSFLFQYCFLNELNYIRSQKVDKPMYRNVWLYFYIIYTYRFDVFVSLAGIEMQRRKKTIEKQNSNKPTNTLAALQMHNKLKQQPATQTISI